MDIEKAKQEYIELCSRVNRDGMDKLMEWLEKSDFFTAPASARFHSAFPGGLLIHSLNVYKELVRVLDAFPEAAEKVDEESIIIASLFHDLCKANFYSVEKRNRKNAEGKWESYDYYTHDEKFKYGGHGAKSVFILQSFIKLKAVEAIAIQNHMGAFENEYVGDVYSEYPFAWSLHIADEAASWLDEKDQDGIS